MSTTPNPRTAALSDAGVSIWLDDLSRERISSGNLAALIAEKNVVGVTTNPTIFANALSDGAAYAEQLRSVADRGVDGVIRELTTTDVRDACDLFMPEYEDSDGFDGRVSIEVDPRLAMDAEESIDQALQLHREVDRENILIKIPATEPGLEAIKQTIARGVSINVTLIFSLDRYRRVIDEYMSGLEIAAEHGLDLSKIHSVASVFVSRIDTEVDKRLDAIGTHEAKALRGKVAVANARLAYQAWQEAFTSLRFRNLEKDGANPQRLLWASTGVKDPALPDTYYVTELTTKDVVNTMPEKTLDAVADHAEITGDQVTTRFDEAQQVIDKVTALGIDLDDVYDQLEREGVEKFEKSWNELIASVQSELDSL